MGNATHKKFVQAIIFVKICLMIIWDGAVGRAVASHARVISLKRGFELPLGPIAIFSQPAIVAYKISMHTVRANQLPTAHGQQLCR